MVKKFLEEGIIMKLSKIVYRICLIVVCLSFFMPVCCDKSGPECVDYAFSYEDSTAIMAACGLIAISILSLVGVFLFREKKDSATNT